MVEVDLVVFCSVVFETEVVVVFFVVFVVFLVVFDFVVVAFAVVFLAVVTETAFTVTGTVEVETEVFSDLAVFEAEASVEVVEVVTVVSTNGFGV